MKYMKLLRLIFAVATIFLFIFGGAFAASGVVITTASALPLAPNHTFTGATLTAVDSSYNSKDYVITSGNLLDIDKVVPGLIFKKDIAYVNLAETSLLSESTIDTNDDFSRSLINNTYNAGVESSATSTVINSELSAAYSDTRLDGQVKFNNTALSTVTWKSDCYYDYNLDGDYDDTGDKSYRTTIGSAGQILYWNAMAYWNTSDTDNYMKITWSFKTTGSSNYDFEIIYYSGAGDSAWSNIDSAGENTITVSLYDTNYTHIAQMASIDELLQVDLGDNPVISGLDYLQVQLGTNTGAATTFILGTVRINNFCVFTDYPGITNTDDNDKDFDINGDTGGLWSGVWDDNDFLVTSITEGTTESYDSTVPLYETIESNSYPMPQDAIKITLGGVFYYLPTEFTISSEAVSGTTYYKTTETWKYTTTSLEDLQTPANVITWTDTYYNMTLDEDVLVSSYTDFDDDLVKFTMEENDKTEELRADWAGTTADGQKINYDGTNPDATSGSGYDFVLIYYTDLSYSGSGGGGGAASTTTDIVVLIILGVLAAGSVTVVYAVYRGRKKDTGSRSTAKKSKSRKKKG